MRLYKNIFNKVKNANYKLISLVIGLIAISGLAVYYVFATWAPPTAAPPGANVPAPINVSTTTQTFLGSKRLNFTTTTDVLSLGPGLGVDGVLRAGSNLIIDGRAARNIGMERGTVANTAGFPLTINAGGATSGATNRAGGDLILASGISTGGGVSNIHFQTATAGAAGTADRAVSTKMTILGDGNVGIGTTAPGAMLDVAGGDVRVQTSGRGIIFPDGRRATTITQHCSLRTATAAGTSCAGACGPTGGSCNSAFKRPHGTWHIHPIDCMTAIAPPPEPAPVIFCFCCHLL